MENPTPAAQAPRLLDQLRRALRARHCSERTEKAYVLWVRRFIRHHGLRHPSDLGPREVNAFLSHLATERGVASSTQNQALSALLFLYRHVLGTELGHLGPLVRARTPERLPVVLTHHEVRSVLAQMTGDTWLMASLLYGSGLRLMECLGLRVQDLDLETRTIHVRNGKGAKDRGTMIPAALLGRLRRHLEGVQALHTQDLAEGFGRVDVPHALDRKYPNAPTEWRWQWVFPQRSRWRDPRTGRQGRHHCDPSILQRAVREAVRRAGVTKRASCHTFRHNAESRIMLSGSP